MSDRPEYEVSDNPWTWVAIYAENFSATDRLHLQLTHVLKREDLDPASRRGVEAHLRQVRTRRQEYYSSLVAAVMESETIRVKQAGDRE